MQRVHLSDCGLHSLPAKVPQPCDCGVAKADRQSAKESGRLDCILIAALRNWFELWSMRMLYLDESLGSPLHSLQKAAKRSK